MSSPNIASPRRPLWPLVAFLVVAAVALGLAARDVVTLDNARRFAGSAQGMASDYPLLFAAGVAIAQLVGMTLSLPTKAVITVLGGALLGVVLGSVATLLGVLTGSSLLFVFIRRVLRARVAERLGPRVTGLVERFARRPMLAIAGLRLIPTLPYAPITAAAALSPMGFRQFFVGSVLGDLPIVVAYCLAGDRLAHLGSIADVLDPVTLAAFVGVGLLVVVTALARLREQSVKR